MHETGGAARQGEGAGAGSLLALMVAAGGRRCAIPARFVSEIMRPLPTQRLAGAHAWLRGLAVIRGAPAPVVDLKLLFDEQGGEHGGEGGGERAGRLVLLDVEGRPVALAVDRVFGLGLLDADQVEQLPPLLHEAVGDRVHAIGVADAQLLLVLRAARLLPDDVCSALTAGQEAP